MRFFAGALILILACPASAADKPKAAKKKLPLLQEQPERSTKRVPEDDQQEIVPKRDIPQGFEKELREAQDKDTPHPVLKLIMQPIKRGMWIRLPIMDTDPNRGVTVGFMPIWVLKEDGDDRIKQIHAPSITYNKNFKVTPTYRYYYYPHDDATLIARGSVGKYERELMTEYDDGSFMGTQYDVHARAQYNIDAGKRFFGIGPNTPKTAESNYKEDYLMLRVSGGLPLREGSHWRMRLGDHLNAQKIGNGPLPNLRGFDASYPGVAPEHRQQTNEVRLTLDYDSRDHAATTTRGAFLQLYREHSIRGFASAYDYNRSGFDGRLFHQWSTRKRQVTALNARYEQLLGNAPFWQMPKLGGKYSLRAYGEGRYVDRTMASFNVEQRYTMFDVKMAGVTTEFELAPFAGMGTVSSSPNNLAAKYVRPVFGGAVRAVARPQVVGSIDFGAGQEGLSVFMDINYSF